jgi:hypothetical protein
MWLGLAIRIWAIAVLGNVFRTTVEVDPGQAVGLHRPLRVGAPPVLHRVAPDRVRLWPRRGQLAGLAASTVVPLPALLWRIRVEEAELNRVLGDAYRAYQTHTQRLSPGLW